MLGRRRKESEAAQLAVLLGGLATRLDSLEREVRRQGETPSAPLEALQASVASLGAQVEAGAASAAATQETIAALDERGRRVMDVLQLLYDDEPGNRRRLRALRESTEYELAYSEAEPLVSVIIPTYDRWALLRDRALPSIIAQTYRNLEVVIVGDTAPAETEAMIAGIGDARLRYRNLPLRGPYPEERADAWFVTGVPPFNAAMADARGRWIAPFADDDALLPDTIEVMVDAVRAHRHEACYGLLNTIFEDGSSQLIGEFPPRFAHLGLQGGIFHSGLRFIEQELADALFRVPSDWQLMRRWLRVGVRVGYLDRVVCDYYPAKYGG